MKGREDEEGKGKVRWRRRGERGRDEMGGEKRQREGQE